MAPSRSPKSATQLLAGRYRISKSQILGEGSTAIVYKGLDETTHENVAVKVYSGTEKADIEESFKQTIKASGMIKKHAQQHSKRDNGRRVSCDNDLILEQLRSNLNTDAALSLSKLMKLLDIERCFVQILDFSRQEGGKPGVDEESGLLFIVLEMGGLSLEEELECRRQSNGGTGPLSAEDLKELVWSMLCITWGLHVCGFVHMDIKPLNIVKYESESSKVHWKLIDLDGAREANSRLVGGDFCYTPVYMPPELARSISETEANDAQTITLSRLMDIWSVGMCATQAVFLMPILEPWFLQWSEETGNDCKFIDWLGDFSTEPIIHGDIADHLKQIDPQFCDLLQGMLEKDPKKRLCAARCLLHPYFKDVRQKLCETVDKSLKDDNADEKSSFGSSDEDGQEAACTRTAFNGCQRVPLFEGNGGALLKSSMFQVVSRS